jgi:hypothetical protein
VCGRNKRLARKATFGPPETTYDFVMVSRPQNLSRPQHNFRVFALYAIEAEERSQRRPDFLHKIPRAKYRLRLQQGTSRHQFITERFRWRAEPATQSQDGAKELSRTSSEFAATAPRQPIIMKKK